jgi:hypothetical protein
LILDAPRTLALSRSCEKKEHKGKVTKESVFETNKNDEKRTAVFGTI